TSTALPLSSSLVEASSSPPPQAARANSHSRMKNKHTSFLHRTDYTLLLITQNRQTRHPLHYLDLQTRHPLCLLNGLQCKGLPYMSNNRIYLKISQYYLITL